MCTCSAPFTMQLDEPGSKTGFNTVQSHKRVHLGRSCHVLVWLRITDNCSEWHASIGDASKVNGKRVTKIASWDHLSRNVAIQHCRPGGLLLRECANLGVILSYTIGKDTDVGRMLQPSVSTMQPASLTLFGDVQQKEQKPAHCRRTINLTLSTWSKNINPRNSTYVPLITPRTKTCVVPGTSTP